MDARKDIAIKRRIVEASDLHARDRMLLGRAAKLGLISPADVLPISVANTIIEKGVLQRHLAAGDPSLYEAHVRATTYMQARTLVGYGVPPSRLAKFGSTITAKQLDPTSRPDVEYCLWKRSGACGACVSRCPMGALSVEAGIATYDRQACN